MLPTQTAGVRPGERCVLKVGGYLPADLASKLANMERTWNFSTKWNQRGLCHQNGLNYVSFQPMSSQRLSSAQDWGLHAKLQRNYRNCFFSVGIQWLFPVPKPGRCSQPVITTMQIEWESEKLKDKDIKRHEMKLSNELRNVVQHKFEKHVHVCF